MSRFSIIFPLACIKASSKVGTLWIVRMAQPFFNFSLRMESKATSAIFPFPVINRAKEIKSRGFRIWYNSLWADFNGGHDDELAMDDPENSYGWLLQKGANIIFSDHPFLLDAYLKKIGRR